MGREYIDLFCGNELAVQKINLSIQLLLIILLYFNPYDVWSGNSPFELVLWIPLVSVKNTKSMFILSPNKTNFIITILKNLNI